MFRRVVVLPGLLAALILVGSLACTRLPTPTPPASAPEQRDRPTEVPAPQPTPAEGTFPATLVAEGRIDFAFQAYASFSSGRLVLACGDGEAVEVVLAAFQDGRLVAKHRVTEPLGKLYDVNVGPLFNDGQERAVITAAHGMLVITEDGQYGVADTPGVFHALIGDWDADGRQETALVRVDTGEVIVEVWRFLEGGRDATKLSSFEAPDFPAGPTLTFLTNNQRRLFIAVAGEPGGGTLPVALFTLDSPEQTARFGSYPLHHDAGAQVTSLAAAVLAEKASIAAAYQAERSYLELFDITLPGAPSRGRVLLPDGDRYMVMIGGFATHDRREVLAITPGGRWAVYDL